MHQIPPHTLWIGASGDLRDWRRLYDLGIHAVLHLAYEEPLPALPHDLVVCRFPLIDGEENTPETLEAAITTLTNLLQQRFACLVCCQAGLSRSPAIAAAALARLTGQSISDSLALVAGHHPCAVHPRLRQQIRALFAEPS